MEIKTIVITGSTRGIGNGLAREFLKRGHQVIVNGRTEVQVKQAVKELEKQGFGSDGRMMDKLSLYGTSKRTVNYFTKSVSREIKDESIQLGILSPGMVRTDFLTGAMTTGSDAEQRKEI